jgi:hypothetical protein
VEVNWLELIGESTLTRQVPIKIDGDKILADLDEELQGHVHSIN